MMRICHQSLSFLFLNLLKCALQICYSLKALRFGWESFVIFWHPRAKCFLELPGFKSRTLSFPAWWHGNLPRRPFFKKDSWLYPSIPYVQPEKTYINNSVEKINVLSLDKWALRLNPKMKLGLFSKPTTPVTVALASFYLLPTIFKYFQFSNLL